MRYSHIVNTACAVWEDDPTMPIYVDGPPGVGKTSLGFSMAEKLGMTPKLHTEGGDVLIFRPSIKDPVDLLGTPDNKGDYTKWKPPYDLHLLTERPMLLVIDEMPQAEKMMQNALAGLMLDRFVGELVLHPGVRVLATGNRTKDKAGANRVVSQLGNRVARIEMETSLDDWIEWALDNELDLMGVAFMKFKPDALFDFDPDRFSNATPRSWERALRLDPQKFDPADYHETLSGIVNEGRAAEYAGFRSLLGRLPNIDQIVMDPHGAPTPEEADVRYACVAALTTRTTPDNFDSLMSYIERLPTDYQVLYVKGVVRQHNELMATRRFVTWSSKNTAIFA